ncbi:FecR family protein [Aestuariibaculum sediminum]|uniref:FecR family protein n=1 Tax=Aestuariibaculum sediminum TaxID=2770637 RepID=A0A8J6U8S4_9FLAO|nr:FecR family protein [Aestuariibaculum sediminum]MBD0833383.1 FecR family protein [Aestuariibaculum sediminum]
MKKIIAKYINNEASKEDCDLLEEWLKDDNNKRKFKEYLRINYLTKADYEFKGLTSQNDSRLEESDVKVFNINYKTFFKYAAAACIIAFVSYGLFTNQFDFNQKKNNIANQERVISPGTNKATLTLQDGTEVYLDKENAYENSYVKGSEKELVYQSAVTEKNDVIQYNYLTIPRGGQFSLVLSDGTKVWLNSDSKLKYPVKFIKGESRQVELVYGEAYFDVTHSSDHGGADFKVYTEGQEVEVLGTEFNVKAYPEEANIYTTLLEGSVALHTMNEKHETLLPGQQSILNKSTHSILVSNVETFYEVAWKKGVFSFKNKSLIDIMQVLSRWYDVDVVFQDKNLEKVLFTGQISKDQDIDNILSLIQNTNFIHAYEIENNKIILKN